MKVILQRKVQVWIEEIYDIDKLDEKTIDNLIDYEKECYSLDTLWETQEDLGPVEIYDTEWNLLYQRENE